MPWVSIGYWATQYSIGLLGSISLFGTIGRIGTIGLLGTIGLFGNIGQIGTIGYRGHIGHICALWGPSVAAIFGLCGGPLWGLSGPRLLGRYWGLVLDECHTCPRFRSNQLILFHIHQIGVGKHSVNCTYC